MSAVESNMVFDRFKPWTAHQPLVNEASIEEFLAFERMLADLSARFANVALEQLEAEIQIALVALRQFLGFDRSTFGEFQEDGSFIVISSSAVDGIGPSPLGPFLPNLTWYLSKLRAGETIVFQALADEL